MCPWDAVIFGFGVAEYRLGAALPSAGLRNALLSWSTATGTKLLCSRARPEDAQSLASLEDLDFRFVDMAIKASLPSLEQIRAPATSVPVRRALPEDREGVLRIAGAAFHSGRYHADPLFPKDLAHRRYQTWMAAAMDSPSEADQVFVVGKPGAPRGFFHVAVMGEFAHMKLAAADAELGSGLEGYALYEGTLRKLREAGVRRAEAVFSPSNPAVMNLYAALGFRFAEPEVIFHRHATGACRPKAGDDRAIQGEA